MKFIHVADLHFGKTPYGISMIDNNDQPYWVEKFIHLVKEEKPNAVLIAGDVYDRSNPSNEAVALLDKMLTQLAELQVPVLMVSGNHDSGQRLSFANSLLESNRLYISGLLDKELKCVRLEDEHGPINFWLMPYVFPALVKDVLGDEDIKDYDTAVRKLLEAQNINFDERNVIVAHQNVMANGTTAERGGSETMIGGVGEIDYTAFDGFEYVALGHIHAAQWVGRETVRYAGSPLCYHFDETKKPKKGPVIVEIGEKGSEADIRVELIEPLHRMREISGAFDEIIDAEANNSATDEYLRIVLTDKNIPTGAVTRLKDFFASNKSRVLEVATDFAFSAGDGISSTSAEGMKNRPVEEVFGEFFKDRTGELLDEKDSRLVQFVAEQVRTAASKGNRDIATDEIDAIISFALEQEGK